MLHSTAADATAAAATTTADYTVRVYVMYTAPVQGDFRGPGADLWPATASSAIYLYKFVYTFVCVCVCVL